MRKSFAPAPAISALLVAAVGCGIGGTDVATVAVAVAAPNASRVTKMTLTMTPGPITAALSKESAGYWTVLVPRLPPGTYALAIDAFDSADEKTFAGRAENLTIVSAHTAQVTITLQEVDPPKGPTVKVPVLQALSTSATTAVTGAAVNVSATARSPENHVLSYLWSDNCGGSFDTTSATTVWHAPAAIGTCALSARIADVTNVTSLTVYLTIVVKAEG